MWHFYDKLILAKVSTRKTDGYRLDVLNYFPENVLVVSLVVMSSTFTFMFISVNVIYFKTARTRRLVDMMHALEALEKDQSNYLPSVTLGHAHLKFVFMYIGSLHLRFI